VENPFCKDMKFTPIDVERVEIVERRRVVVVDKFDPVTVEKLDKPTCRVLKSIASVSARLFAANIKANCKFVVVLTRFDEETVLER